MISIFIMKFLPGCMKMDQNNWSRYRTENTLLFQKNNTSFVVKSILPNLIVFVHFYYLEFGRTNFSLSIYLLFEVISWVVKLMTLSRHFYISTSGLVYQQPYFHMETQYWWAWWMQEFHITWKINHREKI